MQSDARDAGGPVGLRCANPTYVLAAVDAQIKAEYALSGIDKPIGGAKYQLLRDLPESLGRNLPSIAEIEAELADETGQPDESL